MFPVTLTAYGQSLISDIVNIDKIVLVYETVNIESVSSLAPYLPALFEEDACGNLKNNIGNVYIRDLRDDSTSYQANTILFCKYDGSELKPVAGYSQDTPIVKKSDNQILSVYLSFDFSVFTNGFLFASIQAGYSTAAHNTDGLLHLEDPNIESDDTYSVYSKPQADALLQAKQPLLTAGDGISLAGNVARTTGIPFGICDDTSTATKFTVTVPGIYKLEDGVCCLVKNGVITSASGFTLNVNGLGAKPVYSNMAAATRETTIFNIAYTMLFVYDSTRVEGGCWVCYRGYYTSSNSIGYQLRTSTSTLPVKFTTYRYRLYFLSQDHTHFIGANESASTNATSEREPTSEKIDPFGRIVYYSTNGTTNAGNNLTASAIWDQYTITLGYSFGPFTLTANRPVYLRCTPQDDGSAVIDASNTIMQTLPEFADGKIYIFLGVADSTTQIELYINHPVYYHDGTGIRIWPGKAIPSKTSDLTNDSGFITSADIPSDISAFNNDVGYITTETDPTVPNWAKQQNKPSYNLDEVTDGSTRKLSNYVPTSRKVNGNALTSDIVLDLDDIDDGTNRKLPTNVSELTNDSGYLTSYTETDPTVPSWAKQPTKPTYTASEVGALPDTTVIPSKTSDLTNDSGFITSSDIPTNVSEFNNDAGYLTSFTETDPTVPSWAKEQNKPSYTLDEVSDGATRKLSSYVPTSRKINNKALSSDIALNLDDVLDGSTRKLNNYIPYSEVISTINGFDNRRLWQYEIHNTLWAANKRYDVTLTGFSNNNASASLFDGSFETNVVVPKSGTGVILISGKNGSKMWSGGYPYGYLEVAFYYTSVPESVTCRVYSDWAQNPGWHDVTLTNVCKNSNQALYRGVNTGFYGVTQMEITINAKDTVTANVTEVAFYQTRGTLQQMAVFNKTVAQTLYHDLTAPRFRTTDGTSSQFVKGDGSLDSSTYITSASLPTKVSQLTNDVGYITEDDLPDFELKSNLHGGAYKDVNTSITSSTKTSTNLATVNAITSYIEPLIPTKTSDITNDSGFITSASIPTNVSAFTNDAGYLTQHQSLAGVVATAQYNSTNKTIEFYNPSGTKLNTDIDATPFIKDGMINTVEIIGGNLVITFNTDSGKENIVIPLTDIFDASNYYTKTETNTQISSAISDLNLGTASTKNYSTDMNTDANLPTTSAIKSYISNQGFALATDIPENVSDLTNDAGYITSASLSDYVQKVTSTDNAIVRFSGTDGTIQNSKVIIDDAANLILPIATSSTFANNAKLVLGNAWFGSNPSGGLAYGTRSGSTYTGKYTFEATTFRPVSGLDNSIDIGTSSYRWKNLYIAGKICKDGTYQITVPSKSGTMALTSDIPTAVSAFTNDAGYITDADLPTNVSAFTNDAGYLTSYTETDPTVPSWAKQSSKPSYTLDEVTDGTTRKLSNYVPTSRKVNNQALTSDITLTLDEVSDGATRKLSNYVPTSRKVNNKALSSDITLTLDNISDGTNRKIPTDTADLTNGAGFITSFTETDPTVPNWAKQINKPSYNLDEVIDGTNRKLPTKVSDLNNDAGYITGYTETDPTVPAWAKASTKPSYTASEVGALPDTTVIPSKTSDLTNDAGYITSADVPAKTTARSDGGYLYNGQSVDIVADNIGFSSTNNLINTSGVTAYVAIRANNGNPFLGLKEGSNLWYAQAASNYFYFGPTSTKALRLDQAGNGVFQTGSCTAKGFVYKNGSTSGTASQVLVANGTVNTLKTVNNESLLGTGNITVAGDTNVIESISVNDVAQTITNKNVNITVPTKTSDLTNDSGFLTSYTETDPTVPSWAKQSSKPSYTLDEVTDGTTRKLSNYELKSNLKEGAYVNVDETTMTSTSTNLPTGKAVATYISNQGFAKTSQLPTVNDSTITIKKSANDTGDSFTLNQSTGKTINLGLSAVATSGSYNDLTDIPSIQDSLTPGDGIAIDSNSVIRTTGIPFGIVDSTSTSTAFTVTVPGIYKLEDGVTCMVKNGVVTSASGFTINVNDLGAKPVYSSLAAASRETTIFNKAYTLILVYDSTRVDGGCWVCYRATDTQAAYVRFNEISRKPTQPARYYKLYFTSADGTKWVPASSDTHSNATAARPVNQEPIDPFGTIAYSSSSTNYTTSTNIAPSSLWTHYAFTLGYSFNRTGSAWSLAVGSPVYVKCAPQANGSAIMDADTPIVQTLPSAKDDKIYIFLGVASTATKVEMTTNHPIYYHDGNGIRLWNGGTAVDTSNLVTTNTDQTIIGHKSFDRDIELNLADEYNTTVYANYAGYCGRWDVVLDSENNHQISGIRLTLSDDYDTWLSLADLANVAPIGELVNGAYTTTSVTDSLKDIIDNGYVPDMYTADYYLKLCVLNTEGITLLSPVKGVCLQCNYNSKDILYLVPIELIRETNDKDIKLVEIDSDPGNCDTVVCYNGSTGVYSLTNDYTIYFDVVCTESIRDYVDGKVNNILNSTTVPRAAELRMSNLYTSGSYPLVFTYSVVSGNTPGQFGYRALYTDSENSLYYNPSTNTLTCSTFSGDIFSGSPVISSGVCGTSADFAAKTVTLTPAPTSLVTGMLILVTFNKSNTASNPTLKIGNLAAKTIYTKVGTIAGTTPATSWEAGTQVLLRYTGSAWMIVSYNPNSSSGAITSVETIGSFYRNNVTGSGNITLTPNLCQGQFPTISTAGTYTVRVRMYSSTVSYSLTVKHGSSNTYTLTSSNGIVDDTRTLTLAAGDTWSGALTSAVNANTVIRVHIYKTGVTVNTVGVAAASNDYNDLDNIPTIPTATSQLTNNSGFITSSSLSNYVTLDGEQSITGTKSLYGIKFNYTGSSSTFENAATTAIYSSGSNSKALAYNTASTNGQHLFKVNNVRIFEVSSSGIHAYKDIFVYNTTGTAACGSLIYGAGGITYKPSGSTGGLIPYTASNYTANLGAASTPWVSTFTSNLKVGPTTGTVYTLSSATSTETVDSTTVTKNHAVCSADIIRSDTDGKTDLGSSNYKFNNIYVNNIRTSGNVIPIALCETAANVAAKTATLDNGDNFVYVNNSLVLVHFANTNLRNNPTLLITGDSSARPIFFGALAAASGLDPDDPNYEDALVRPGHTVWDSWMGGETVLMLCRYGRYYIIGKMYGSMGAGIDTAGANIATSYPRYISAIDARRFASGSDASLQANTSPIGIGLWNHFYNSSMDGSGGTQWNKVTQGFLAGWGLGGVVGTAIRGYGYNMQINRGNESDTTTYTSSSHESVGSVRMFLLKRDVVSYDSTAGTSRCTGYVTGDLVNSDAHYGSGGNDLLEYVESKPVTVTGSEVTISSTYERTSVFATGTWAMITPTTDIYATSGTYYYLVFAVRVL